MTKKTVNFNKIGIGKLPNDKPVVYKIQTNNGKNNYTGVAKRGRVQERLEEHLRNGQVPGSKIQIERTKTIDEARAKEYRILARSKPRYNKQGK